MLQAFFEKMIEVELLPGKKLADQYEKIVEQWHVSLRFSRMRSSEQVPAYKLGVWGLFSLLWPTCKLPKWCLLLAISISCF